MQREGARTDLSRRVQGRDLSFVLIPILWIAFGLRLWFMNRVNPFVDEYISFLACRMTLERGAPIMPSGLLYSPKGLLHS